MTRMSVEGSLKAGRDGVPGQPQVHRRYLFSRDDGCTHHLRNGPGGVWHARMRGPVQICNEHTPARRT